MDNESIRRYQIKEKIGAGGMGTVYRAWDRELERDVALKWLPAFLSADETFSERFKREVRVIAHLEHPHIVPIYDVGESEGRPYIIMRLLSGGTLRDRIDQGNFNLAALVKTTEQISDALAAAHARQIIHRDIKPGNILFDEQGSAFLSDFGIAKVLDSGTQLTGSGFIGTPAYMSPEQFTGQKIDGRSDQYSLAVVVYEALTGALPFEGNTAQMMYQHINVAPAEIDLDRHPIPTGLSPVLLKALGKEAGQRYARVTDFATAMAISMRMEPTTASVLLPVIVGTLPPGAARPPTAPTEMDTPEEKVDTVAEDYRTGLEALALGKWAAAVSAFDRVLDVAPEYGSAAEFSRQAKVNLEQATAVDKTIVEPPAAPVETPPVAPVEKPPVDATMVEPPVTAAPVQSVSTAPTGPVSTPPTTYTPSTVVPPQEPTRRVPLWAAGLALLLLLIITGYGLTQVMGRSGGREPSAAENAPPIAAAAVETSTPQAENTATSQPEPSVTPLPAVAATTEPIDTPSEQEATAQPESKTPVPIIQNPETTTPAETAAPAETPTEEPTAVPAALPAAVRVIVSSANLRRGPGTVYPVAGAILADQEAIVLATNRDGSWYNVELADGSRAWLAASVTEPVDAAAMASVPVAATIPVAPTSTPRPPTPTRPRPTAPPLPPTATVDSGGGGGSGGGGNGGGGNGGGGGSEPPPKYTAEPP